MDSTVDLSLRPQSGTGQAAAPASQDLLHGLELAVRRAEEGLTRWQEDFFAQLSPVPLTGAEITLFVLIGRGGQATTIKDLARATNRTDIPNIQYSLRKLASAGLTEKRGAGRSGVTYSLTDAGRQLVDQMQAGQEQILSQALPGQPDLAPRFDAAARALEELAELYRLASRLAGDPGTV